MKNKLNFEWIGSVDVDLQHSVATELRNLQDAGEMDKWMDADNSLIFPCGKDVGSKTSQRDTVKTVI